MSQPKRRHTFSQSNAASHSHDEGSLLGAVFARHHTSSPGARNWRKVVQNFSRSAESGAGWAPVLPLGQLDFMRSFFRAPASTKTAGNAAQFTRVSDALLEPEIDEHTFVEKFRELLAPQQPTVVELQRWFRAMDVRQRNAITWGEFTTNIVERARGFEGHLERAKGFIPVSNPDLVGVQMCASVRRIATHDRLSSAVSIGQDGLVKIWAPSECRIVKSINNSNNSPHLQVRRKHGVAGVPVTACTDAVYNPRGTHCFVSAVDKSVSVFEVGEEEGPDAYRLVRSYLGVSAAVSTDDDREAISVKNKGKDATFVDTTLLLGMADMPTTFDVTVNREGKEILLFGQHNGRVAVYPTMRLSRVQEIDPLLTQTVHRDHITKIRHIPSLEAVLSASWDRTLILSDLETLQPVQMLGATTDRGGLSDPNITVSGHTNAVTDFAYFPTNRTIASCGNERSIFLWNSAAPYPLAVLQGHGAPLVGLTADQGETLLISLDAENILKVWDLRMHNRCIQTINISLGADSESSGSASPSVTPQPSTAVAFHPTSCRVLVSNITPHFYSAKRALSQFPHSHTGHSENVVAVCLMTHARMLVTADPSLIMVWCADSGRRQCVWDVFRNIENPGRIVSLCKDSSERILYILDSDGTVTAMNYQTGERLSAFNGFAIRHHHDTKSTSFLPSLSPTFKRSGIRGPDGDPIQVFHLSNGENTARFVCVLYTDMVVTAEDDVGLHEPTSDKASEKVAVATLEDAGGIAGEHFACGRVYPASGKITCASLIVGTTVGRLMTFSPVISQFLNKISHPSGRRRKSQLSSFGKLERRVIVEDIALHHASDLLVSVTGDNNIFFWDMHRLGLARTFTFPEPVSFLSVCAADTVEVAYLNEKSISGSLPSVVAGAQTQTGGSSADPNATNKGGNFFLTLGDAMLNQPQPPRKVGKKQPPVDPVIAAAASLRQKGIDRALQLLVCGCDSGDVFVFDSQPILNHRRSSVPTVTLPLLTRFRATAAPVKSLQCLAQSGLIMTLADDVQRVPLHTRHGEHIGSFGQEGRWHTKYARTFEKAIENGAGLSAIGTKDSEDGNADDHEALISGDRGSPASVHHTDAALDSSSGDEKTPPKFLYRGPLTRMSPQVAARRKRRNRERLHNVTHKNALPDGSPTSAKGVEFLSVCNAHSDLHSGTDQTFTNPVTPLPSKSVDGGDDTERRLSSPLNSTAVALPPTRLQPLSKSPLAELRDKAVSDASAANTTKPLPRVSPARDWLARPTTLLSLHSLTVPIQLYGKKDEAARSKEKSPGDPSPASAILARRRKGP